eukprot:g16851.t1
MDDLAAALEGVQFAPDPAAPADPIQPVPAPVDPAPAPDPAPIAPAPIAPAPDQPDPDPAHIDPAPAPEQPDPAQGQPVQPEPPPNPFEWNISDLFPRQMPARPDDRPRDYFLAVKLSQDFLEEVEQKNCATYRPVNYFDVEFFDNRSYYRWVRVDRTVSNPRDRQNFLVCFGNNNECLIFPSITAISRVLGARTTTINWIIPV